MKRKGLDKKDWFYLGALALTGICKLLGWAASKEPKEKPKKTPLFRVKREPPNWEDIRARSAANRRKRINAARSDYKPANPYPIVRVRRSKTFYPAQMDD
jgi:hypothetical protein